MLDAGQRVKYEAMVAGQQGIAARRGTVWVVDSAGKPKAVNVRLGISDGSYTELLGKELKIDDEVIVGTGGSASRGTPSKGGPRFGI